MISDLETRPGLLAMMTKDEPNEGFDAPKATKTIVFGDNERRVYNRQFYASSVVCRPLNSHLSHRLMVQIFIGARRIVPIALW